MRILKRTRLQADDPGRNRAGHTPIQDIPAWVHGLTEPERGYMIEICRRDPSFCDRCREAESLAMQRACIAEARQRPAE